MAKGLFGRPKNAILVRDYGFFAAVLSYMVEDNIVTLEVKVFAGINTEYVIKNTENFSPYLRSISISCCLKVTFIALFRITKPSLK